MERGEDISLWAICISFMKMGAVLIGGGYALLPLLEREVVARRGWAKSEEMMDLYALGQVLPGVIAINTAMLIGNRLRGFRGTLAAAAGLTAAPFLFISAYAAAYGTLRDTELFAKALTGIQSAVAGMILGLGVDMLRKVGFGFRALSKRGDGKRATVLAVLSIVLMLLWNPSFVWLVLFSIVAGVAVHLLKFRKEC